MIDTREELIATVGTSVKDKYLPYKVVIPLRIRQFYRDTGGRVLEVAPEYEVVSWRPFTEQVNPLFLLGEECCDCNEKEV